VRNKRHFPSDQAAANLIWLAPRNITENWKTNPPISWHAAKAQLAIQCGDRLVLSD
jgi:putative transposase